MAYNELIEKGTKVFEEDFYNGGIYLYTIEYWIYDGIMYIHENHPNSMQYTGKTKTYQPSIGYAEFLITDYFPVKIAEIINELTDYIYKSKK